MAKAHLRLKLRYISSNGNNLAQESVKLDSMKSNVVTDKAHSCVELKCYLSAEFYVADPGQGGIPLACKI